MILTKKSLTKLEEEAWISLTPEQRAIMLLWYGNDGGWDAEDFYYGLDKVLREYPGPRPKQQIRSQLFDDYIGSGLLF